MTKFLKAIYRDPLKHPYFYLVLILLALLMSLTLHDGQKGADGKEYLRWTHSLTFDGDLHLLNNVESVGGSYKLTPTGYVFERVNIGAPLLWLPFYRAALLFLPPEQAGDADPAQEMAQILWINFSSWLYPVLGGVLTFGALRRWFSAGVVWAAMLAVLVGTPVLFYTIDFPFSAHPASIFLSSLLLFVWLAPRAKRPFLYDLALGVVIGWLMTIASYNIVFFVLPGCTLLKDFVRDRKWASLFRNGLAVAGGGLAGFAPQLIVWGFIFGDPFYSPYAGQLLWAEPYLLATLFSPFHGLFIYAPVLLLVIPGLWRLRVKDAWAAAGIGLAWLLLVYIVSSNVAWWAGASFGNRYFLTLTPFFVLGLAAFIQWGRMWAAAFILPAVLWTVGLYLQLLNGVGLVSDSVVFSMAALARGQVAALTGVVTILPQLAANRPWPFVSVALLPTFILIFILAGRLVYGWATTRDQALQPALAIVLTGCSLLIILFIGRAGLKGEQAKAALAAQGFYEQPHEVVRREIKEFAGKAGLVTRAMYHRQTGRPDRATADLKRAAAVWKADDAASPQRLYLGPKDSVSPAPPAALHLDYPGDVRLIGYQILEANEQFIQGELFWEKLPGEKSRDVVRPIIRTFDRTGALLGGVLLDFPFPAHYIPPGGVFKDSFLARYTTSPEGWVWLEVSLDEDAALPTGAAGESRSSLVGSVNVKTFPPTPLVSKERSVKLIGKPALLVGDAHHAGEMIPVQLVWQISDDRAGAAHLALNLLDAAGQTVAQDLYPLRIPAAESRADATQSRAVQNRTYCLTPPETLPEGDYTLEVGLQPVVAGRLLDAAGELREVVSLPLHLQPAGQVSASSPSRASSEAERPAPEDGALLSPAQSPTICRLLEARFSRQFEQPAVPHYSLETLLTEQIELAGYDFFIVPEAGSPAASLVLYWHALANVNRNYLVSVQLLDAAGQTVVDHTGLPQNGLRPTTTWLEGEWILDQHAVKIPALPPGRYRLALSLIDAQTGAPIETGAGPSPLILQERRFP